MTLTLTCANCGRQETHVDSWEFPGWYLIIPRGQNLVQDFHLCSEECGSAWLMRQRLERQVENRQ